MAGFINLLINISMKKDDYSYRLLSYIIPYWNVYFVLSLVFLLFYSSLSFAGGDFYYNDIESARSACSSKRVQLGFTAEPCTYINSTAEGRFYFRVTSCENGLLQEGSSTDTCATCPQDTTTQSTEPVSVPLNSTITYSPLRQTLCNQSGECTSTVSVVKTPQYSSASLVLDVTTSVTYLQGGSCSPSESGELNVTNNNGTYEYGANCFGSGSQCNSTDSPDPDQDTDSDGTPDSQDDDMDGDGVPDQVDTDTDGDGIPDDVDVNPRTPSPGGGGGSSDQPPFTAPPTEGGPTPTDPDITACTLQKKYNCTDAQLCSLGQQQYCDSTGQGDQTARQMLQYLDLLNQQVAQRLDNPQLVKTLSFQTQALQFAIDNQNDELLTQAVRDLKSTMENQSIQGVIDAINSKDFSADIDFNPTVSVDVSMQPVVDALSTQTTTLTEKLDLLVKGTTQVSGLSCDSSFSCDGDPATCASLELSRAQRCSSDPENIDPNSFIPDGLLPTSVSLDSENINLDAQFDTSGFLSAGSCNIDITLPLSLGIVGNTDVTLPFSKFCSLIQLIGNFVVISALVFSIKTFGL